MSTSYYAKLTNALPGPANKTGLHIGLNSAGCNFVWQGHRDLDLVCVEDWTRYLSRSDVEIFNEYGNKVNLAFFMAMTQKRPSGKSDVKMWRGYGYRDVWTDNEDNLFIEDEFS